MHKLSAHSKNEAAHSAGASLVALLASDKIADADSMISFVVRGKLDLAQLRLDVWILLFSALQICQNLLGFIEAALHDQPTRTLRQPWYGGVQDDDEYELQCQRYPPCHSSREERKAKCNPVGE